MRRLTLTALALSLSCPAPASAGWPARWCRPQPRQPACVPARPARPPRVVPTVTATPQTQQGDVGAAVAYINAARAAAGRPPLVWSPYLAAEAARNFGTHGYAPPGASQVQAWGASPYGSAVMWVTENGEHTRILMSANREIGIGASAGGWTANLR